MQTLQDVLQRMDARRAATIRAKAASLSQSVPSGPLYLRPRARKRRAAPKARAVEIDVWSLFDGNSAMREGWCLTNDSSDRTILARLDEMRAFEDDFSAAQYVAARALSEGGNFVVALLILRLENFDEYERVVAYVGSVGLDKTELQTKVELAGALLGKTA